MPDRWTYRLDAHFTDSRPVLDLKYDMETRVRCLLTRNPQAAEALVFRGEIQSYTTASVIVVELRLKAAYDTRNLYSLRLEAEGPGEPPNDAKWEENLRRSFDRWTIGLPLTEARAPSSPDRYRQVVEETVARELELANRVDREAEEAIRVIQEGILDALREGKSFSTVHKEGGTNIRLPGDVFVFADYGESSDREEFASPEAFLARLRKFYDWESRRDWYPHPAPEIEVWKYIERKLM